MCWTQLQPKYTEVGLCPLTMATVMDPESSGIDLELASIGINLWRLLKCLVLESRK